MPSPAPDDLAAAARDVEAYTKQVVRDVGKRYKQAITPRLTRDSGGDRRLSGVPGMPRMNVSVTARVSTSTGQVKGRVTAAPKRTRGPWRWLNDGTRPHQVNGRQHPGARGKGTWDDPVNRERPAVDRDITALWDRKIG